MTQITNDIDQIRAWIHPILQVRDGNQSGRINKRVLGFDDHITRGVNEDERRVTRVSLHQPDDDGDIVGDVLIQHRDCAVRLEEVDGASVVVGEDCGFGLERGIGLGEREEMLTDEPFDVFGVRK